jgi:hypothetical protein
MAACIRTGRTAYGVFLNGCGPIMPRHPGVPTMNAALLMVLLMALIAFLPETDGFSDEGCVD